MTRNLGGVLSYQFGSTYASNQKLAIYQDLSGFNIDTPPATLTAGYGFQQLAAVDVSVSLAEKYAATVEERYALEQEGQRFLLEVSKTWKSGAGLGALDGIEEEDGVYYRKIGRAVV